ncbi:sporulation YhaL family protein [Bacillus sp. JCM 19034]|uniref:sporulation YhaL family protein n=1 Tax=Bacillus sp. JCM 19034 TaxID=1481928 RepID=UPI000A77FFE1|nr:sporulation YhaL family protein [Bacillus sp. JCM 19034]
MNRRGNSKYAYVLLGLLLLGFLLTQTPIGTLLVGSPWWVYLILIGIVISGYLAIKYTYEDYKEEQKWIEQEGNVYMERIKEKRGKQNVENT